MDGVETQFALIRFAITGLSNSGIQRFFKRRLDTQVAAINAGMREVAKNFPDEQRQKVERGTEYYCKAFRKSEKKKNRAADSRFKVELSEDRLNQSELLLLVAHFESFMKKVHRTFLTAAPAKVFSGRDTKVILRDVFEPETSRPFDKFLNELIIKEVKWLDSQRMEQRAKYFVDHFGVSFGSDGEIEKLKEIMTTRNRIAHEIYSPPPATLGQVTDQPLVSDQLLEEARTLFREVPRRCISAGAKAHPMCFRD
jgi:hypothetical protein